MNFSVLHFFRFASRMPQIAQILVLTFQIFWVGGACPWTPLKTFLFFFSLAIPGSDRKYVINFLTEAAEMVVVSNHDSLHLERFQPEPCISKYPLNNNNNNNCIQRRYSRLFTISSQRRNLSPTRTLKWPGRNRVQITCNTLSAYHVQVSCYVPLGTKGQLSY